ncbi:DUF2254 domain-containing protein [Formosa sp. PL04]|uniref:DUF2254 domain-containing protein n=1 Tax=Formosa sp. PL04 TaxID=3081755 RepID=UPI0029822262|nr:DUF2254 domain-containing protein [Formosa sp. PL04]MDW5288008.1 DUF2254 domain-containing protein [Formosa sp. PL04]
MKKSLLIYLIRLREQLWFRPLIFCFISIIGALLAHLADGTGLKEFVPNIKTESVTGLLTTISSSMLVIAIFAVSSMISAFSAASSTATPRSFKIVVTDDASKNALSMFIGAFIFSIVATIALQNGYYAVAGRFVLFVLTLLFFTLVILTFLRWVDRISRLGRLEHTIRQVENVAHKSLEKYIKYPLLKGIPISNTINKDVFISPTKIGYIQYIDMQSLQELAEESHITIQLNALAGKYVYSGFPLVYLSTLQGLDTKKISEKINDAIHIGSNRLFDEDPRFGLIALSEIASRALSPGINDPGTAIQIIGSQVRLFFLWNNQETNEEDNSKCYDRIEVPELRISQFFESAFRPISRDGANNIEVMLRLQKAYSSLATLSHSEIQSESKLNSETAFNRAKQKLSFEDDLELLKQKSLFYKISKDQ